MGRALVSTVIPAHNYGRYVGEAIDSVLAQTYSPVEVVVVDDGSTDDTRARLAPYASMIRYLHQEKGGLSAARNTGIRQANGEWIALLDADDLWHPEKLELQLRSAARLGEVALVGSPQLLDPSRAAAPRARSAPRRREGLPHLDAPEPIVRAASAFLPRRGGALR